MLVLKFRSGIRILKMIEDVLCKTIIEKKIRENLNISIYIDISKLMTISISTISGHIKNIYQGENKLDKWFPNEVNELQSVRRFEECSMLYLRMINFLIE